MAVDWYELMLKRNSSKVGGSVNNGSITAIKSGVSITLFNCDKIDILKYGSTEDKWGITRNCWTVQQRDFVCDVQYATDPEKITTDFGYNVEVSRIIYCVPNENLVESSIIRYDGTLYKIIKIKKCKNDTNFDGDKYWKVAIVEHDNQNLVIEEGETNE